MLFAYNCQDGPASFVARTRPLGCVGAAMPWRTLAALVCIVAQAAPANAFCWYGGVDNAHISMNREFADSRWVVRARVLAAKDGETASGPNSGEGWTAYRLQVLRAYKGQPPSRLIFSRIGTAAAST